MDSGRIPRGLEESGATLTYRDLPSVELLQKLMATSFDSPSTNKQVFDWCEAIKGFSAFRENERVKLIGQYGETVDGVTKVKSDKLNEFFDKYGQVLDMEIEDFPKLPIDSSAFSDDKCFYPKEHELWISPKEIQILELIKQKQGE